MNARKNWFKIRSKNGCAIFRRGGDSKRICRLVVSLLPIVQCYQVFGQKLSRVENLAPAAHLQLISAHKSRTK